MHATRRAMVSRMQRHGHGLFGQGGFSLVELMVSLVISMLIGVAALGSVRMFIGTQRQSVDAGTVAGNAIMIVEAIKQEAGQAGLGFLVDASLPCQNFNLSTGNTLLALNEPLLPLRISNSSGNRAQLDVLYADALESTAPALLDLEVAQNEGVATLKSYLPVRAGHTVMFMPLGGAGQACTIKTVASVDAPQPGLGPVMHFDSTGLHNQVDFPGFAYSNSSAVLHMGKLNWSQFAVDGSGNLRMSQLIQGRSAVLARNVVGFELQYGVTNGVTSSLDSWQYAEGSEWGNIHADQISRIVALRLALVLRSDLPEKLDAHGNCNATVRMPDLLDRPLSLTGNWACYRYRSSTATIPLRNVLLGGKT